MKHLIIFSIIGLLLIILASAITLTNNAPNNYNLETSTTVTFNITCIVPSIINDTTTEMNASIYWKTNRTGAYINETPMGAVKNATGNTTTITFTDGDRVWWKSNCYDLFGELIVSNESSAITSVTENSTFTTPAVNATIDLTSGSYLIANVVGWVNNTGTPRLMVIDEDYNKSNNIITNLNASLVGNTSLWSYGRHIDLVNDTYKLQDVTGWINDSGGTYRLMVNDADYDIVDGLIYPLNSSLNGNTSLWSYSWPSSKVNSINSSVSIFDIDVAYYTVSLGIGKLINFTLDTGAIVASSLTLSGALTTNTLVTDSIDTGQGVVELYNMSQNVSSDSDVIFATVDTGQGANELYDMNQNVLTTSEPTFTSITIALNTTLMTCDNNNGGKIYYDNTSNEHYGCNTTAWNELY